MDRALIPRDARIELYGLQVICEGNGLSYADQVWKQRYPAPSPLSTGAWPFVRAADKPSNVTKMPIRKPKP